MEIAISLVGAVGSTALAIVFPPIIETLAFWPDGLGKYKWMLVKNILLVIFGMFGFSTGAYATIRKAIDVFRNGD